MATDPEPEPGPPPDPRSVSSREAADALATVSESRDVINSVRVPRWFFLSLAGCLAVAQLAALLPFFLSIGGILLGAVGIGATLGAQMKETGVRYRTTRRGAGKAMVAGGAPVILLTVAGSALEHTWHWVWVPVAALSAGEILFLGYLNERKGARQS